MPQARLFHADVLDGLARLEPASVQCVVTSPPYWGLRDYPVAPTEWPAVSYAPMPGVAPLEVPAERADYGLESTPEAYVAHTVHIARLIRRALRPDGIFWLNLGDSFVTNSGGSNAFQGGLERWREASRTWAKDGPALKPKDLAGIPWRVAFALQADGWWLRSDNIWAKPNCMPESVEDRATRAHEYVFQFARSERYFYDALAIAEPVTEQGRGSGNSERKVAAAGERSRVNSHLGSSIPWQDTGRGRNARTVWTIPVTPYAGAHFAVMPEELARRCILAGSSPRACERCGAPWARVTERVDSGWDGSKYGERVVEAAGGALSGGTARSTLGSPNGKLVGQALTTGWRPTCECAGAEGSARCVVLDPFGGSGTTAAVAVGNGRDAVYIDGALEYLDQAEERVGPFFCRRQG